MLISYHWLKKFIPGLKATPEQVAEKITLSLVEVESITRRGEDAIIDIENKGITNRPDCFSHLGVAREVASYFDLKLDDPLGRLTKTRLKPATKLPLAVEVKATDLCQRYNAVVLTNLTVAPSPRWLQAGLENCGIRPINNVVDITNYVMLELGQPLHAFDYEKVEKGKIIVRRAQPKEQITTLDGAGRDLNGQVLMIADSKKAIGIAGIMGGKNSEITFQTRTIVLEAANFNAINNRLSAKFLKLRTEASTRFEKDLENNLTYPALIRATQLLQELAGAKVVSDVIDLKTKPLSKPKEITLSLSWLNNFLGLSLTSAEVKGILQRLSLELEINKDSIIITVPSYRRDLSLEADIAEEVARILGYDRIPITLPQEQMGAEGSPPLFFWRRKVKETLVGLGFTEIHTYSLIGEDIIKKAGYTIETHSRLRNPLSEDRIYLRRSLIPGILEVIAENGSVEKLKIFESAKIFLDENNGDIFENEVLIAANCGEKSFLTLKGHFEALAEALGINDVEFIPLEHTDGPWLTGRVAEIKIRGEFVGVLGEISPQFLENFSIAQRITILNIGLEAFLNFATVFKTYTPIPKYPPIIEDLAFNVPVYTHVGQMIQSIKQVDGLINNVDLLDSFDQTRTFRITYQHQERTMTDREVGKIRKEIIQKMKIKFAAELKQL
ncbi:phenylalanine--tRNA ligase subunit beta [Candidatus Shapirobacteria bacterium]|nr:phenylalanine--tRNA ligase subunit beta [Candidatus Shapirobacteria bacterium]